MQEAEVTDCGRINLGTHVIPVCLGPAEGSTVKLPSLTAEQTQQLVPRIYEFVTEALGLKVESFDPGGFGREHLRRTYYFNLEGGRSIRFTILFNDMGDDSKQAPIDRIEFTLPRGESEVGEVASCLFPGFWEDMLRLEDTLVINN